MAETLSNAEKMGGQTVVHWNTFITGEERDTLPWMLKNAGYATGIVGKNHVIEAGGIVKPAWDADPEDPKVIAQLERNAAILEQACQEAGFDYAASLYHNNPSHNGAKALIAHNMEWITAAAVNFIGRERDAPFFLWFATTLPHGPNTPEKSWRADPRITSEGLQDVPAVQAARSTIPTRLEEAGVAGWQRENLLWMDDALGAIIQKLRETGQLDNTVIFYFNDHGQLAKGTIYQGGVHGESFVWRQGGWPAGPTCDALVSNVDYLPTILDLCEVKYHPDAYDGVSFLPALMGKPGAGRESLYFELGYVRGILRDGWKYIALRYPERVVNMSREERQKRLDEFNAFQRQRDGKIYNEDPMAPFSHIRLVPGGGDAERRSLGQYPAFHDANQLYFLPDDPGEQRNLAHSGDPAVQAKLAELRNELQRYLDHLPGHFDL